MREGGRHGGTFSVTRNIDPQVAILIPPLQIKYIHLSFWKPLQDVKNIQRAPDVDCRCFNNLRERPRRRTTRRDADMYWREKVNRRRRRETF